MIKKADFGKKNVIFEKSHKAMCIDSRSSSPTPTDIMHAVNEYITCPPTPQLLP